MIIVISVIRSKVGDSVNIINVICLQLIDNCKLLILN